MAAPMEAVAKSNDEVFNLLHANLQLAIDQLKGDDPKDRDFAGFTSEAFWQRLEVIVKRLSHEAVKLCVAFSKPPVPAPEESQKLVNVLEQCTLMTVSLFYGLPDTQGLHLQKMLRQGIITIVTSLQQLANDLRLNGPQGPQKQLQSTGSVWESCDAIQELPRDSGAAAISELNSACALVKDALDEIEEALRTDTESRWSGLGDVLDEFSDDAWSDTDRQLIAPCLGLVKAAKASLKKTTTAAKSNVAAAVRRATFALDELMDQVAMMSPAVDDLITVLYPPLSHASVRLNSVKLANTVKALLAFARGTHICAEEDNEWMDFLVNVVDHNIEKVKQLAPASNGSVA
ncbi:PREDICTED: LOW QUALITY PROTEIN: cyclin-D1-binding protein 1 homolog [Priapulus caudatus]|uniref:LOW QUALITY PROTEIN: cyclin-D1-binding protein 1 homolog n=1 Tax=Priapulus caudatus TaxID=37621 RepID=A0ABM1EGV2_PRICU|nr:PREDICTED: LOW QUALITY PROTEIN: cyclin-D1-binding protein 1 homolog [Priapulus caudatus]